MKDTPRLPERQPGLFLKIEMSLKSDA